MVLQEAPTASEIVYDADDAVAPAFTFTGRFKEAFCHVAVYTGHVNLGFNLGSELLGTKVNVSLLSSLRTTCTSCPS